MGSKCIKYAKSALKKMFSFFGLGITRKQHLEKLLIIEASRSDAILELLSNLPEGTSEKLLEVLGESKSQLQQDLFALGILRCKRNGFFVEFGAADGISLSNTYLLERNFGWTGILAEPAIEWQDELRRNRPNSKVSNDCVWATSGIKLEFLQTKQKELSTIETFSRNDSHESDRLIGVKYQVNTISLRDLLNKFNAPKIIDLLSIDTEGSEYEILKAFDFSSYNFSVIVCEHNYTENRNRIYELLISNGYVRVFENISLFDDWYIFGDLVTSIQNKNFFPEGKS